MRAYIQDENALNAITPTALSAYARCAGWNRTENYGKHADVYTGEGLPEVILPRTQRVGDYSLVVSRLIDIFAEVAESDELALYRELMMSDRDVIRVKALESQSDGTVALDDGLGLVGGARDMILAAACSYRDPQPFYRAGANKEAMTFLKRMRLGQPERGSFVISFLTPLIPPPMQPALKRDWPMEGPLDRQITRHLAGSLKAANDAAERLVSGDMSGFQEAILKGVNANLCDALVRLLEPFQVIDVSVIWARTHPMTNRSVDARFAGSSAPMFREAAKSYRDREPKEDVEVFGFVHMLKREQQEEDGTVTIRGFVEGEHRSVKALLSHYDYQQAIDAHDRRVPVIATGDLERIGSRWHLRNPRIAGVLNKGASNEDPLNRDP